MKETIDRGPFNLTLTATIEYCAWLSVVTIGSGFIWVKVIAERIGLPREYYFSFSDYINFGLNLPVLFAAAIFGAFALPMGLIQWDGAFRRIWPWPWPAIAAAFFIVVAVAIDIWQSYTLTGQIDSSKVLGGGSAALVPLVLALLLDFFRPNIRSIGISLAILIWLSTALAALGTSIDLESIKPGAFEANGKYQFDHGTNVSPTSRLALTSEHYLIFFDAASRQTLVIKRDNFSEAIYTH